MFTLVDDFNGCVISRHRSLKAVARAIRKLSGSLRRRGCYLPTHVEEDGEYISEARQDELEHIKCDMESGWIR